MRAAFSVFRVLFCLPMLIVGCLMIVLCVSETKHRNEWVRAEGVIQSITEDRETDGDIRHTVTVQYQTEDGDTYTEVLGYYQTGYHEGQKVGICYDPKDPSNVTSSGRGPQLVMGILGGGCLGSALFIWVLIGFVRKKAIIAQQNGYLQ